MDHVIPQMDFNNDRLREALELIVKTKQCLFLTGKAGTGKSTFLRYIRENLKKNFVVVAPTGIAAINVKGVTIHSFFQFPFRPMVPGDEAIKVVKKGSQKHKIIKDMDALIIDEVSMVRSDMIDGIDAFLRENTGNKDRPFGGKQVIFIGDLFQLEPVLVKNSSEEEILYQHYRSPFFFDARIFNHVDLVSIELEKVYRQENSDFIELLDKVRTGEAGERELELLNQRHRAPLPEEEGFSILLSSVNAIADKENKARLQQLDGMARTYYGEVEGTFDHKRFPTANELTLKEGAQVMFVKNDPEGRWVNGTIGKVQELKEDKVKVELADGEVEDVEPDKWENIQYGFDTANQEITEETIGTFTQYPLKLAWAVTIHKSQGLTFDQVVLDLGNGAFAGGQVYVALSRCRTLEGLSLRKPIRPQDIFVNDRILEFARHFNDTAKIQQKLAGIND